MSTHIIATLLHARCDRIMGLATLQAEFEQHGRLYTRSKLVAMQCFGHEDADWQRCVDLYRTLIEGRVYSVAGDTLAASDGTVLLLGTFSIRPAPMPAGARQAGALQAEPRHPAANAGHQPDITAVAMPMAAPRNQAGRAAA